MKTGIFKTDITDHYSKFCITDLLTNTNKSSFLTKRAFSNKNISKFKKCLINFSWTNILGGNLKLLTHRFICSLAKFLRQAFPKKY